MSRRAKNEENGAKSSAEVATERMRRILTDLSARHATSKEKQSLATMLVAVQEIIQERRRGNRCAGEGDIIPAEYFGALMSALDSMDLSQDPDAAAKHLRGLLYLLSVVLPAVSPAILRRVGNTFEQLVLQLWRFAIASSSDNKDFLKKGLVSCFGSYLRGIRRGCGWRRPNLVLILNHLLSSTLDDRPKTRRAARMGLVSLLDSRNDSANDKMSSSSSAALDAHVLSFAQKVMMSSNAPSAGSATKKLQFVSVLRAALPFLSSSSAAKMLLLMVRSVSAASKGQQNQIGGVGRQAQLLTSTTLSTVASMLETLSVQTDAARDIVVALRGQKVMPTAVGMSVTATSAYVSSWALALASSVRALVSSTSVLGDESGVAVSTVIDAVESLIALLVTDQEDALDSLCKALHTVTDCCAHFTKDMWRRNDSSSAKRLCCAYSSVVQQPRYSKAWQLALPAIGALCRHALADAQEANAEGNQQQPSSWIHTRMYRDHLVPLVRSIDDLRQSCASSDTTSASALALATESVLAVCLKNLGVEAFLDVVPLRTTVTGSNALDIADERTWLLPFLCARLSKSGAAPATLTFFRRRILALAGACEKRSQRPDASETRKKHERVQCVRLWQLFPGFCANARDVESGFGPLARTLGQAVADSGRYPELVPVVCRGLSRLVERASKDDSIRRALSAYAKNFMPLLFNQIDRNFGVWPEPSTTGASESKGPTTKRQLRKTAIPNGGIGAGGSAERVAVLATTVCDYAKVTDPKLLDSLSMQAVKRLATSAARAASTVNSETRADIRSMVVMLTITSSLVPCLSDVAAQRLFQIVSSLIGDDAYPLVQKRAYLCLEVLCGRERELSHELVKQIQELLQGTLVTCTATAKRHRLGCIRAFLDRTACASSPSSSQLLAARSNAQNLAQLLGEILLCTKESNRRAREAAFGVLVSITRALPYDGDDGSSNLVTKSELLQMAAGALATRTPHMRSAALQGLSVILFEIASDTANEDTNAQMISELIETVLVLMREKSREVIKSVLGFLKVAISVMSTNQLRPLVPQIVRGLLLWSNDAKNRFRLKVRVLIERLVRKVGADAVAPHVPSKDQRLMAYIVKSRARQQRKRERSQKRDDVDESDVMSASKDANESDTDDDDNESDDEFIRAMVTSKRQRNSDVSGKKKKKKSKTQLLRSESEGNGATNLLDVTQMSRRVIRSKLSSERRGAGSGADDGLVYDKEGRLVIVEDEEGNADVRGSASSSSSSMMQVDGGSTKDEGRKEKVGKIVAYRKNLRAKRRDGAGGSAHSAKNYRSSKGKGDVKRKGQVDPYAYIKFDRKMLGKRRKRDAVGQYGDVLPTANKKGRSAGKRRGA